MLNDERHPLVSSNAFILKKYSFHVVVTSVFGNSNSQLDKVRKHIDKDKERGKNRLIFQQYSRGIYRNGINGDLWCAYSVNSIKHIHANRENTVQFPLAAHNAYRVCAIKRSSKQHSGIVIEFALSKT